MIRALRNILDFYTSGFRSMTWGKTLWLIIFIKLFIIFFILKLFFFKPFFRGKNIQEKQDFISTEFVKRTH